MGKSRLSELKEIAQDRFSNWRPVCLSSMPYCFCKDSTQEAYWAPRNAARERVPTSDQGTKLQCWWCGYQELCDCIWRGGYWPQLLWFTEHFVRPGSLPKFHVPHLITHSFHVAVTKTTLTSQMRLLNAAWPSSHWLMSQRWNSQKVHNPVVKHRYYQKLNNINLHLNKRY